MSVVALPTSVSVASGNVIVLSEVGSATVNVVSLLLSVAPSNTITPSSNMFSAVPTLPLLIVGEVNVLFVSVCEPVSVATVESIANVIVLVPVVEVSPVPPNMSILPLPSGDVSELPSPMVLTAAPPATANVT